MRRTALVLLLAAGAACAGAPPGRRVADLAHGRVVDLTHAFDAATVYWPTGEGFERTTLADGPAPGGFYYRAGAFCSAEHGGTHLDAPSHFARDGASAEAIPPERLVGPGVLVDASARCADDAGCRVGVADLVAFESRHGRIPERAIVLVRTGWGARWPDRERYLGTAARGVSAVAQLRFPGLDAEAARLLAAERGVDAVGIDTASIDSGDSTAFEAHRALAARGVPVFENLAALEALPATGFAVVALPMKIAGGSGGPLRIVAIVTPVD